MPRLNFREIASTKEDHGDKDQFEKFSKEFVELVLKMEVAHGPSRGAPMVELT